MDDNQVIRRVQKGDTAAFALLVDRYHRNLLNFIYRLVGDEALVEDLGQDVFLSIFRKLPEFDVERGGRLPDYPRLFAARWPLAPPW